MSVYIFTIFDLIIFKCHEQYVRITVELKIANCHFSPSTRDNHPIQELKLKNSENNTFPEVNHEKQIKFVKKQLHHGKSVHKI